MPHSTDYCLNSQKAGPDVNHPEACQPGPVTPEHQTDAESNAAKYRIFSPRQWYWIGLAAVALVFIAETALTWRKWSNINGDLGLDLYVPWRL
ncbi:MAG: hypothetical protein ACREFR_14190, partial [Limisphaerales bacterium]